MSDHKDVSAEPTANLSIGFDGIRLWKVIIFVGSGDDRRRIGLCSCMSCCCMTGGCICC